MNVRTSIPEAEFEAAIPVFVGSQTLSDLDHGGTVIDERKILINREIGLDLM